jgi:hypothetical protein
MSIVKERPTWSVAAAPTFLFSQLQSRDSLVGIVTRLRAGTSKELWFDCGQDFLSNSERADPL